MIFLYDNLIDNSSSVLSANSENANYPADFVKDYHLSAAFRSTQASTVWLMVDFGSTGEAYDMGAIAGHNISSTATIKIQGASSSAFGATDFDYAITGSTGDLFSKFSTQGSQYVRILVNDASNTDGYIEIGRFMVGSRLELTRGFRDAFTETDTDTSEVMFSVTGQPFGVRGYRAREYDLDFPRWEDSIKRNLDTMIDTVRNYKPVFTVLDETNSTSLPPVYGVFVQPFNPSHRVNYKWYGRLKIRETF